MQICVLEICKAAPWSSKDILVKIYIISQALWCCLWGGGTSAWAQKRLQIWALLHSLHLQNEQLKEDKERCSVYAEPSKFIGEASELAEEQLLSPTPFIHCQSRGQTQTSDKDGTPDHQKSSQPVAGQCAAPQLEQSNILWRISVTAKQAKIKLTPFFPLKLCMMVTSRILSYWGYSWIVQCLETWGKVIPRHCAPVAQSHSALVKKHHLSTVYWNISIMNIRPNYWLPFTLRSWKELWHSILYCAIKFEEVL